MSGEEIVNFTDIFLIIDNSFDFEEFKAQVTEKLKNRVALYGKDGVVSIVEESAEQDFLSMAVLPISKTDSSLGIAPHILVTHRKSFCRRSMN